MSVVPIFQDGELPHGSSAIVILETGETHVCDNIDLKTNTKKLQRMGKFGRRKAVKILDQGVSGSADIQLETETSLPPQPRNTFVGDLDADGNTEGYQVDAPGRTYAVDDIYKSKISFEACENPLIYRTGGSGTTGASAVTGDLTISAISVAGANTGDLFTAAAHGLLTGDRVTLTVTTGLTGLTTATDYYVIKVSADTFNLATSYTLAVAGTVTTFSADGTGYVTLGLDLAAALPRNVTATAGSWVGTNIPTGCTLDATTGKVSGKPTAGVYAVKITYTGTITVEGSVETRKGVRKFTWTVT